MKKERQTYKLLQDELKYESVRQEIVSRRFKRYFQIIPVVTALYSVIILIFFLFRNGISLSLYNPVRTLDVTDIENRVNDLQQNIKNLEKDIKVASGSGDLKTINIRVNQLEENQKNIVDSIDMDVNKALTARLLQEKEKTIETEILQIQTNQNDLNKRVDNLITALVAIPLGGFVLSLISTLIYYLINKSKKKNSEK